MIIYRWNKKISEDGSSRTEVYINPIFIIGVLAVITFMILSMG